MVISLERGADLHMAQLMPLPLTISCFSKVQIGFTFLVTAHPGSPRQEAVKRVCVCIIMQVFVQCWNLYRRTYAVSIFVINIYWVVHKYIWDFCATHSDS